MAPKRVHDGAIAPTEHPSKRLNRSALNPPHLTAPNLTISNLTAPRRSALARTTAAAAAAAPARTRIVWTPPMIHTLLHTLISEIRRTSRRPSDPIKPASWRLVLATLKITYRSTTSTLTVEKCQSKLTDLRKRYAVFKALAEKEGFACDMQTGCIEAEEEAWEREIARDGVVRGLREGLVDANFLGEIVEGRYAEGHVDEETQRKVRVLAETARGAGGKGAGPAKKKKQEQEKQQKEQEKLQKVQEAKKKQEPKPRPKQQPKPRPKQQPKHQRKPKPKPKAARKAAAIPRPTPTHPPKLQDRLFTSPPHRTTRSSENGILASQRRRLAMEAAARVPESEPEIGSPTRDTEESSVRVLRPLPTTQHQPAPTRSLSPPPAQSTLAAIQKQLDGLMQRVAAAPQIHPRQQAAELFRAVYQERYGWDDGDVLGGYEMLRSMVNVHLFLGMGEGKVRDMWVVAQIQKAGAKYEADDDEEEIDMEEMDVEEVGRV